MKMRLCRKCELHGNQYGVVCACTSVLISSPPFSAVPLGHARSNTRLTPSKNERKKATNDIIISILSAKLYLFISNFAIKHRLSLSCRLECKIIDKHKTSSNCIHTGITFVIRHLFARLCCLSCLCDFWMNTFRRRSAISRTRFIHFAAVASLGSRINRFIDIGVSVQ